MVVLVVVLVDEVEVVVVVVDEEVSKFCRVFMQHFLFNLGIKDF